MKIELNKIKNLSIFLYKFVFLTVLLMLFTQLSFAIEIYSDEISFDSKENICVLSGNSEIILKKNTFKADKIIITGDIKLKKPKLIEAFGNISFDNGHDILVKCDNCKCDMENIQFYNNVLLKEKNLGEIKADSATYNIITKKISITSNKKVKLIVNKKLTEKFNKKSIK